MGFSFHGRRARSNFQDWDALKTESLKEIIYSCLFGKTGCWMLKIALATELVLWKWIFGTKLSNSTCEGKTDMERVSCWSSLNVSQSWHWCERFYSKTRLGLRKREDDRCWCWHDGENSDNGGGKTMMCDVDGDEYDRGNRDCWSSPSLISECVGANLSNKDVSYWGEASLFSESLLSRWWLWWGS